MSASVHTWTCRGCGQGNKSTWRFCAACELMPDGLRRDDLAPKPPKVPGDVLPAVLTVLLIAAVVAAVVLYRPEVEGVVLAFFG
jgi:hypothetical protein